MRQGGAVAVVTGVLGNRDREVRRNRRIIDRGDRDRHAGSSGCRIRIGCSVGESEDAEEVRERGVDQIRRRTRERSRCGSRDTVAERIAIDIGGAQRDRDGGVFRRGHAKRLSGGRVVDGCERDRHSSVRGVREAIERAISKGVRSVIVGHRYVAEGAIRADRNRAVRSPGDQGTTWCGTIHVGSHEVGSGASVARVDCVLIGHERGIGCKRSVVDRGDRNGDGSDRGVVRPIEGSIGERVGPVVIRIGRVGECPVAADCDGSVGGSGQDRKGDRVAIDIRAGKVRPGASVADIGAIFRRNDRCVGYGRGDIGPADGDRNSRSVRICHAIRGSEAERIGAEIAGSRRIGKRAISVQVQCSMGRSANHCAGQ